MKHSRISWGCCENQINVCKRHLGSTRRKGYHQSAKHYCEGIMCTNTIPRSRILLKIKQRTFCEEGKEGNASPEKGNCLLIQMLRLQGNGTANLDSILGMKDYVLPALSRCWGTKQGNCFTERVGLWKRLRRMFGYCLCRSMRKKATEKQMFICFWGKEV